jgi:hypothetical protein
MRTLVQRLKRLWNTPVEFYGVDRPEPQAGPWHGLLLFVILLVVLGLLWLIRYIPERTYLVHDWPNVGRGAHMATTSWLIVAFGEPGLDRPLSAWRCEGPEATERCSPSSCGQPAPQANQRHGVLAPGGASAWSPGSRGI